jgi:hypothetical protein
MLEYLRIWYIFQGLPPFAKIFWGLLFLFFFLAPLIVRLRRGQDRKRYEQMKPLTDWAWIGSRGLIAYAWWEAVITHWNWYEPFFGTASWWLGFGGSLTAVALGLLPSVPVFFKTEKLIKEAQSLNMDAPFKTKPGFWAGVYMVVFIFMVTLGILGGFLLKDWLVRHF